MSQLLKHSEVRHALSLLGINEPEADSLHISLQDLFAKARVYSDDKSDDILYVRNISCSYMYDTVTRGKRKISFTISKDSEHELSSIFVIIMFMKYGLMNHKALLAVDKNTPLHLIRISENFIKAQGEDDHFPF